MKLINKLKDKLKKKEYTSERDKQLYNFLLPIMLIPAMIWLLDYTNIFSILNVSQKLTANYDWFSLIGAYVGTIVSAYFLIYVTSIDREANTESVRESQRPNLCTKVYLPNRFRITDTSVEGYIAQEGSENSSNYYTISISNSGQTVAIIDTQISYLIAEKYKDITVPKNKTSFTIETQLIEEKVYFNKYEDRLHINAGSKAEIVIIDQGMYRDYNNLDKPCIKEVYIEYEDLFGKRYKDHIQVVDGKTIVCLNNVKIN